MLRPTVRAVENFDAKRDAEILIKAMKGLGTDEKAIISVLAHRSSEQRASIARKYKEITGKELSESLKKELSGDFRTLAIASISSIYDFLARELHDAMAGLGTKEDILSEILGVSSNETIRQINASYLRLFDTTLEKDIKRDTSGTLENLFVLLCQGNRDESTSVDSVAAKADAAALYNAGEGRMGTDESTFTKILAHRSRPHLRVVFDEYKRIAGKEFIDAVKAEFRGGSEAAFANLVLAIDTPIKYLAQRLYESMKGLGTKEKQLNRIILWRSEIDLGDIKTYFPNHFEKSLEIWIDKETSGDYKKMLRALID